MMRVSSMLFGLSFLWFLPSAAKAQTTDHAGWLRQLLAQPRITRAFRIIQDLEPRTQADLITLTQVPAPPFKEQARAKVFAQWLRDAGADSVFIDGEGNVVGLRRGTRGARTIALGGHLDTVFPEGTDVTVKQRGDTLYAPGVGDDTRGLMVVLTVLRAMQQADIRTRDDIWFVGVVGEEGLGDLRGMKYLFREGALPLATWIEIDASALTEVVNRGLGSYRYRVTFKGPGGHSWTAFGTANPIHALGRAITHFVAAADPMTRSGERTSFNVGTLTGGTSVNSIAAEATMEVDMRSEDPASLERIDRLFKEAMQRGLNEENAARRSGRALELIVNQVGNRPSGTLSESHPLVQRALISSDILAGFSGLNISSTNTNVPIARGIPAVTIGRGGVGGNTHSADEWWLNCDGHLAIQRALLLLVAEAGLDGTALQLPRPFSDL